MSTPVFVCTGFLDSGKTTLVKDTLMEQDWIEPGLTLLIVCEEGEEEYSKEYLEAHEIVMLTVEEPEQLNREFFVNCVKNYHPSQVVIEYNGMWNLGELLSKKYPKGWEIQGIYSTVNGETLDMYLKNMRNLLMEQLTESSLIVVNRCDRSVDRSGFRRALKVQNPLAQLIFEDPEGQIIQPSAEDLPYDVKGDRIVIEDIDFGVWYVDAYDHPGLYLHKEIEFVAQAFRPKGMGEDMFVPVRKIMTCCANDMRFYGYPCKVEKGTKIPLKKWIRVTARFEFEPVPPYGNRQPVLYLVRMEPAKKPEEEVVYLG